MSENIHRLNVDGLPKQFVSSLKVLFDILDEDRSGYIRLVDIESRWNGEGVRGLPVGVIEALRKVAPTSGYLSFDRFVMGLKLAMFKSKHSYIDSSEDNRRTPTNEFQNIDVQQQRGYAGVHAERDFGVPGGGGGGNGSVGIIQLHHIHPPAPTSLLQPGQANLQDTQRTYGAAITATVRPNNAINIVNPVPPSSVDDRQHRGLHAKSSGNTNANIYTSSTTHMTNNQTGDRERYISPPPPRPQRTPLQTQQHPPHHPADRARSPHENPSKVPPQVPPRDYRKSAKSVIINELKQWQKHRIRNNDNQQNHPRITSVSSDSRLVDKKSNPNYDIYVNVNDLPSAKSEEQLRDTRPTSKVQARRREPRRHTVANGVDYNMVKRMKQFEEEKDMLRQGLQTLDKAREWYQKQMNSVEVKQRNFSNPSPNDAIVEDYQQKLNRQKACINEVNQRVKTLIASSERGIPVHMNLAVKNVTYSDETITINMLKEQNRQLTKEVGQKGERITKLEREKASLIREMFEVRAHAKNKSNYDDTTFM